MSFYCTIQSIAFALSMEPSYMHVYRTQPISHPKLLAKITQLYRPHQPLSAPLHYDQLLYVLDQHAARKADRTLSKQLYAQARGAGGNCTLHDFIETYIQNLETAKLCLIWEEYALAELQEEVRKQPTRQRTFAFVEVQQIDIYSRFTPRSILTYEIVPSEILPITLHNALNPNLNHQFVLQMEMDHFDVNFYESGVKVWTWQFPDEPGVGEGEYHRLVRHENVTFEARIRYQPRGVPLKAVQLQKAIQEQEGKLDNSRTAFIRLCEYEPMLAEVEEEERVGAAPVPGQQQEQSCLSAWLPCFSHPVTALYYSLIAMVLLESLYGFFDSSQFLDIAVAFYGIGLLHDKTVSNYATPLIFLAVGTIICIIKTVWTSSAPPTYALDEPVKVPALIISVAIEVAIVLQVLIIMVAQVNVAEHRDSDLFGEVDQQDSLELREQQREGDIWETKQVRSHTNYS